MGKGDLQKTQAGQIDPEEQVVTKASMICGMIYCIVYAAMIGLTILLMILEGGHTALFM